MKAVRPSSRGFTLIELMIVVAIIGILASIGAPMFMHAQLRARATERPIVARAIATAVGDVFRQTGSAGFVGDFNPPVPAVTVKRPINWRSSGWPQLHDRLTVEGDVYYSYYFAAVEAGPASSLTVIAVGDLDGDGQPSTKTWTYQRQDGAYVLVAENPPSGQEDASTF